MDPAEPITVPPRTGGTAAAILDPSSLILSPRTRRRQRGRGTVVLDNLTSASTMTNPTVLTPELLQTMNPLVTADVINDLQRQRSGSGNVLRTNPSPDEMMIQSRGPRRVPLTFSPDIHLQNLASRQQQRNNRISTLAQRQGQGQPPIGGSNGSSPTASSSNITRLLLPTRTSPRKRLNLNDSPPSSKDEILPAIVFNTPSPDKMKRMSPISRKTSAAKSLSSPASPLAAPSPPKVLVRGLSHSQLANLVENIIDKHPEMEEEVSDMLPSPDLSPVEQRIYYLKKNIFKALPNTRLESKTDSLAYNRVAVHLLAFKKAIVDEGKILLDSNQFKAVVDYTIMAWGYVRATPLWDNPPHNGVRRQCFKSLANNCSQALKKGAWSQDLAQNIKTKLLMFEKDSEDIQSCIKLLDAIINKGND